jgi:hypothetical protein
MKLSLWPEIHKKVTKQDFWKRIYNWKDEKILTGDSNASTLEKMQLSDENDTEPKTNMETSIEIEEISLKVNWLGE